MTIITCEIMEAFNLGTLENNLIIFSSCRKKITLVIQVRKLKESLFSILVQISWQLLSSYNCVFFLLHDDLKSGNERFQQTDAMNLLRLVLLYYRLQNME